MFARVTHLQFWKSEHDEETCEDACGESVADGLFAIADGAGTTLFSNIWAKILIRSFLTNPLLSADPFEVEWWVRQAQEQFKQEAPDTEKMAWNALQKTQNQGSYSTLATLRVWRKVADAVYAKLLIIGDSCVLIGNPHSGHVQSFLLDNPTDFERAPVCLPSKRSIFHRYFHRCHMKQVKLLPGDVVALATDAVSKWVISAANGRHATVSDAFQELIAQTPATWERFILECRDRGEMADDDSTALIIALTADALESSIPPGTTRERSKALREKRKKEFTGALEANNKELIAITYGDGVDMTLEGATLPLEQVEQARQVADALQEVLQILRQEINSPDAAARVGPIWQQYAPLLLAEPCAANLRQTLARIGVIVTPSAQAPNLPPPTALPEEKQPAPLSEERQLAQAEFASLQREREQLELERRFIHALRIDDDEAILTVYNQIQQSPYAGRIAFYPQELERINLAQQRETARKQTQAAPDQITGRTLPAPEYRVQQEQTANEEKQFWSKLKKRRGTQHA